MPRPIGTLGTVDVFTVGSSTAGVVQLTDISNLIMLTRFINSGTTKYALRRDGVDYTVASGKTFKSYAIRHTNYAALGYADNAAGTTNYIAANTANGPIFATGVPHLGSGPYIMEVPANKYVIGSDITSGSQSTTIFLFGYEV